MADVLFHEQLLVPARPRAGTTVFSICMDRASHRSMLDSINLTWILSFSREQESLAPMRPPPTNQDFFHRIDGYAKDIKGFFKFCVVTDKI